MGTKITSLLTLTFSRYCFNTLSIAIIQYSRKAENHYLLLSAVGIQIS